MYAIESLTGENVDHIKHWNDSVASNDRLMDS